jgi:hypothetical protein
LSEDLEGINGVGHVQMGFKRVTIHGFDWPREQLGYVPLATGIAEQVDRLPGSHSIRISMSCCLGFASAGREVVK